MIAAWQHREVCDFVLRVDHLPMLVEKAHFEPKCAPCVTAAVRRESKQLWVGVVCIGAYLQTRSENEDFFAVCREITLAGDEFHTKKKCSQKYQRDDDHCDAVFPEISARLRALTEWTKP